MRKGPFIPFSPVLLAIALAGMHLGSAKADTAAAAANPWNLSALLDIDSMINLSGVRGSESSAQAQWDGSFDTSKANWWQGGLVEFSLEGVRVSGTASGGSGAVQVPDNEWAPNFLRVYQLTYKQDFGGASVRAGIMDLNQYFEASDQANLLHNSSFGMSPDFMANFNAPSFPNPGLGMMGEVHMGAAWQARAGVWQGNPPRMAGALDHGALVIGEVERDWSVAGQDAPLSDIKLGAWRNDRSQAAIGSGLSGAYLVGETRWKVGSQQWGGFVMAGTSSQQSAHVTQFLGAGFLLMGPFASRPWDQCSIGLARINLRGLQPEAVVEAVYSVQLTPALALQPDLQHFWNPGGLNSEAWLAGARLHLTF